MIQSVGLATTARVRVMISGLTENVAAKPAGPNYSRVAYRECKEPVVKYCIMGRPLNDVFTRANHTHTFAVQKEQ